MTSLLLSDALRPLTERGVVGSPIGPRIAGTSPECELVLAVSRSAGRRLAGEVTQLGGAQADHVETGRCVVGVGLTPWVGTIPPRSVPLSWYTGVVFGEVMWTEDSETHIARHNVTPLEVEQVLYSQPRLAVSGRDDTTEVLGQTDAGRLLLVVVTEAGDGRDFVVTDRDMTANGKRTFRERSH